MEDPEVTVGVEFDTDSLAPCLHAARQLRPSLDEAVGQGLAVKRLGRSNRNRGDEGCHEGQSFPFDM